MVEPVETAPEVVVLDYGSGNLRSVVRALERAGAEVTLTGDRRTNLGELRATEEEEVGGTDLASAISELQQTMTVLEASQASFSKLSGLSLFTMLN